MTAASPLSRLLRYSRAHRRQVWWASACSVLNKFFDLAPPVLIGLAVDVVVQQQDSLIAGWGVVGIRAQFVVLSLLTVLVWGLESAFEYAYDVLWRNLAQTIQRDLRVDAYDHLQELELAYFEDRSTGRLMAVLNDDINQLERFLDRGANEVLQVITTVILIGAAFFVMAPGVAWMAMLPMPFIIWGAIAFQKLLAPRYAEVRERVSLLNSRLANNLTGMLTIKSFTAEAYEVERIRQESEGYRLSNRKAIAFSAAFIPLIRILILLGFTGTLLYGGLMAVEGTLAVGTYSVLVFLTQRLLWPLTRLGETLDQYQRAMASTTRVMGLLDTPITLHPGQQRLPVSNVQGDIRFEDVGFAYAGRDAVVQHLTLKVPAGQTVAIVGSTGSGKSTLVKLLLRFYEVNQGALCWTGWMYGSWPPRICGRPLVWSVRMCFYSTARWRKTLPTAPLGPRQRKLSRRPAWPRPTSSSVACPRATTPSWGNGARSSLAVSVSGWRSPAPLSKIPPSWCWMRPPRRWTTRRKRLSSDRWRKSPLTGRRSRSPIASPPSATPTASM
jgi:ATP-binding cassette subfamily B protein